MGVTYLSYLLVLALLLDGSRTRTYLAMQRREYSVAQRSELDYHP